MSEETRSTDMFDQPNQSSDPQQDPSTSQFAPSPQQVVDPAPTQSSTEPSIPSPASSYVDAYVPPTFEEVSGKIGDDATNPIPDPEPVQPVTAEPSQPQMPQSAPAPSQSPVADTGSDTPDATEQLEDQNIFDLLGIQDATESEKELFLDELQQVIWEDFVENDVELLLTEEEMKGFKAISNVADLTEDDKQSQMIEYLEKLVPDLEKIMLEKALELKEEMTRERISEMKDVFKDNAAKLAEVEKAQSQADAGQWRSVALTLNAVGE